MWVRTVLYVLEEVLLGLYFDYRLENAMGVTPQDSIRSHYIY
jgi:hypothetical protein